MKKIELPRSAQEVSLLTKISAHKYVNALNRRATCVDFHDCHACSCYGIGDSFHSPFFVPAEHGRRDTPAKGIYRAANGRRYQLLKKPTSGFGGYGVGGAGDNCGGLLQSDTPSALGSNLNLAALMATRSRLPRLVDLLPGGVSGIVPLLQMFSSSRTVNWPELALLSL